MNNQKSSAFTPDPDSDGSIYIDVEYKVAVKNSKPSKKGVNKGKGAVKLANDWKSHSETEEHQRKEKALQDRIHWLEQEVIRLQLKNNLRTVATPGLSE